MGCRGDRRLEFKQGEAERSRVASGGWASIADRVVLLFDGRNSTEGNEGNEALSRLRSGLLTCLVGGTLVAVRRTDSNRRKRRNRSALALLLACWASFADLVALLFDGRNSTEGNEGNEALSRLRSGLLTCLVGGTLVAVRRKDSNRRWDEKASLPTK